MKTIQRQILAAVVAGGVVGAAIYGVPRLVEAAITLSITLNTASQTELELQRIADNKFTCRRLGLPATCTQAQACVAANAVGGSGCTAAQADAANARIFFASQTGRENHAEKLLKEAVDNRRGLNKQEEAKDFCAFWLALTQGQRDTECARYPSDPGCDPGRCQ